MMLLCFPKRSANNVIPFLLIMMLATRTTTIEALSFTNLFCRRNPCTSDICSTKGQSVVDDWTLRCKTTINDEINNDITMVSNFENDNSTAFVYLLQSEVRAWHMGGSTNQRAQRRNKDAHVIQRFKSHKAQWMKETCCEWPSKCSTKDCSSVPTVGAHVVIDGKENVHLVPMCQSCNRDLSKNWLPEKEERNGIQPNNDAFELRKGTKSIELSHISKYQSMIAMEVISWDTMYDRLVLHVGKYNTTSISRELPDNKLREWVIYQRVRYKAQTIPSKEICLLEDIGFSWDPNFDNWNKNFALLGQYKNIHGDCNVPYQYDETGQNLAAWLNTQRQNRKNNRFDTEKEKQLDDLGVIWEPLNDKWEKKFKLLQQYKLKNGKCNVPKQYKENGVNLGSWLDRQRQEKKNKRLHAKKENILDDLGVIWEPYNEQWEENFKLLQQYKLKNGDCNVPQGYEENGVKLGIWLDTQRQDKKNNKLKGDKKEKLLDDLGVIWEPYLNQWEEKYELLEQFKNERGHCNVSTSQKEDEKYRALGQWLSDQRVYYRKGNLRPERQTKLDKLGVEWNPKRKRKE